MLKSSLNNHINLLVHPSTAHAPKSFSGSLKAKSFVLKTTKNFIIVLYTIISFSCAFFVPEIISFMIKIESVVEDK